MTVKNLQKTGRIKKNLYEVANINPDKDDYEDTHFGKVRLWLEPGFGVLSDPKGMVEIGKQSYEIFCNYRLQLNRLTLGAQGGLLPAEVPQILSPMSKSLTLLISNSNTVRVKSGTVSALKSKINKGI